MRALPLPRLVVVVGAGGVGKTTLAAALGLESARDGLDTLVMTFDPSLRLKDALGVGEEALRRPQTVNLDAAGRLEAGLLEARATFDRLVAEYSPDAAARQRILQNRYYQHLAGSLAGILEYMAVERLYEAARQPAYRRIVLDTPPTRQALDFLEAPQRIVQFLDSGALRLALKPWFDAEGRLRPVRPLGPLGRKLEALLDNLVGLDLLHDMAEFFQAFAPLYDGFRERATEVEKLLRSAETRFLLVSGPGEERIAETMYFARCLQDRSYRLAPVVVNRLHPECTTPPAEGEERRHGGAEVLRWLGERDRAGLEALGTLLPASRKPIAVPLVRREPTTLKGIEPLGRCLRAGLLERDAVPA